MTNVAKQTLARKRPARLRMLLIRMLFTSIAGAAAWAPPTWAQDSPIDRGLAGGGIARIESVWSAANPGSLPFIARGAIVAALTPPPIVIDRYVQGSVLAVLPIDSAQHIGLRLDAAGVPGYREMDAAAMGALPIGPDIGIGASLSLRAISIDRYGTGTWLHAGIGLLGRLGRSIRVGGSLAGIGIAGNVADIRSSVRLGFAFDVSSTAILSIDVAQEVRRTVALSLGISGLVADGITLRAGAGSGPARLGAGLSVVHDDIIVDYGAGWIVPLGFRHTLGAGLRW